MPVDPIKPTLKAPGTKRLKLKDDELLSSFAFKFNLRRYDEVLDEVNARLDENFDATHWVPGMGQGLTLAHFSAQPESFCVQFVTSYVLSIY